MKKNPATPKFKTKAELLEAVNAKVQQLKEQESYCARRAITLNCFIEDIQSDKAKTQLSVLESVFQTLVVI